MKKIMMPFAIALLMVSVTVYAGDEKKEVIKVIQDEFKAFIDKDYDAWTGYWVHEPYVSSTFVSMFGFEIQKSWDSIAFKAKSYMEKDAMKGKQVEKKDFDVHIDGDLAVVYLKEYVTQDFMGIDFKYKAKSIYTLKKVDKKWKFISMMNINKTTFGDEDLIVEMNINMAGYKLLGRDEVDKAIKVFKFNTEMFPDAFNTWDSLAEAYLAKGDKEKSIEYYKKSIELNPGNTHAEDMIKKMQEE